MVKKSEKVYASENKTNKYGDESKAFGITDINIERRTAEQIILLIR